QRRAAPPAKGPQPGRSAFLTKSRWPRAGSFGREAEKIQRPGAYTSPDPARDAPALILTFAFLKNRHA
ncbi:MAG: hypothetical protein RI565_09340, partial [Schleiferiaceae bacterium]|nr:hypothetical protein [Schleiferiaceae bacterium]